MEQEDKPVKFYVTTTYGLRGYFAVLIGVYRNGWSEPHNTGVGSYETVEGARLEAKSWAESEGIEYAV
jgi:hypothetical protein